MRLKDVSECNPSYAGPELSGDVAFVPMEALRYGNIAQQEIGFAEGRGKYTYFANGDLLFAKVTPCFENGNIAVAENLKGGIGFGSSEIFVLRTKKGLLNKYLFYVAQGSPFRDGACATMCGVGGLKRMSPEFTRTFELDVLPLKEQQKIVAYLDEKNERIDERIRVLEHKLLAYRRLKTSVVNSVVTGGLDSEVILRDSGVDLIGQLPRHWQIVRFKDVAEIAANLVDPEKYMDFPQISPENIEKNSGRLISYTTVYDSGVISGNHYFKKGMIVYSKIRPALNKLTIAPFDGLCSADMYPIKAKCCTRYLAYTMLSSYFVGQVAAETGMRVKMPKINQEELTRIVVLLPPDSEQDAIANYLDAECAKIDEASAIVEKQIDAYKRLKRSLINEVVTGKRKVA